MWNPKQSTKPSKVTIGTSGTNNEGRGQGTPRQRDLEPSETGTSYRANGSTK